MNELVSSQRHNSASREFLLSSKVQSKHLEKLALVYVRQSRQKQVEQGVNPRVHPAATCGRWLMVLEFVALACLARFTVFGWWVSYG